MGFLRILRYVGLVAVVEPVSAVMATVSIAANVAMGVILSRIGKQQRRAEHQEKRIEDLVENIVTARFDHHATTLTKTAEAVAATARGAADTLGAMVRMIEKRQDTHDQDLRALMQSVNHLDEKNQTRSENMSKFILDHCATKEDIRALNGRFDRELLKRQGGDEN